MAVAQDRTAVVNQPVANMFSRATSDSDVVSQAILGTNVAVIEGDAAWSKIRTPDGYTGWVNTSHLVSTAQPYAAGAGSLEVVSLFAHLYREKSVTKHAPLLTVPFETRLEPGVGADERWLEVILPDRRSAWVQRGDVLAASSDSRCDRHDCTEPAVSRAAVHVGRNIFVRLRLFRLHADAAAPPRRIDASRRARSGSMGRCRCRREGCSGTW